MSEHMPRSIEDLRPKDVIEFTDITQLPIFEDAIATHIEPEPRLSELDAWQGRQHIRDLIRPEKFNGTIANIQLEVMTEPYEQLVTSIERGWKIGQRHQRTNYFAEESKQKFMGFVFTADANSSGRGTVGQIQTEIWYCPSPEYINNGKRVRTSTRSLSPHVERAIAKPKIEIANFITLDETSRHIAYIVLSDALRKPMIQPISQ